MSDHKSYVYLAIWNMNGGPIHQSVQTEVEKAVQSILNDAEKNGGARHLYSVEGVKQEAVA